MPRMTRPVPHIGRFPFVAVLSLIAVVGTITLSSASLVIGAYVPILAVGVNGVLVLGLPAIAAVHIIVRYGWRPRLRLAGFTTAQVVRIAAAAALVGWLNVAWVGIVGVLGAILSVLWLLTACAGRLIPALRWDDDTAADQTATGTDTGNIFPVTVLAAPVRSANASAVPAAPVEGAFDARGEAFEPSPEAAIGGSWVLVPEERPVVDDNGEVVFTVGPTAWALAIGGTNTSLRLRDFSGREGNLTDVTGVIRN